jgi:hypothetical protein
MDDATRQAVDAKWGRLGIAAAWRP